MRKGGALQPPRASAFSSPPLPSARWISHGSLSLPQKMVAGLMEEALAFCHLLSSDLRLRLVR